MASETNDQERLVELLSVSARATELFERCLTGKVKLAVVLTDMLTALVDDGISAPEFRTVLMSIEPDLYSLHEYVSPHIRKNCRYKARKEELLAAILDYIRSRPACLAP